jgi:hypothetical protein
MYRNRNPGAARARTPFIAVAAHFVAIAAHTRNQSATLAIKRALARFFNIFGEQTVDQVQAQ